MKPCLPFDQLPDLLAGRRDRQFHFQVRRCVTTLSFAQVHEQVAQAVQLLQSFGIDRGAVVGMVADNGFDGVLADLALVRLGCTTVHVPEHGAEATLRSMDDRLDALLVLEVYREAVVDERYLEIGTLAGLLVFQRKAPIAGGSGWTAGAPAVIFSSGTTGHVKKLLVNREGVVPSAQNFFRALGPRSDDLFLLFLPLSNYQQKLLIYGCILSGVSVCLTDQRYLLGALSKMQPTLFLAPPLFYESAWKLAQTGDDAGTAGERLRGQLGGRMRMAWSGMAPIPPVILEGFGRAGVPLYEAYGMTEFGPIASNAPGAHRIGSVGRPLTPGSVSIAHDGEIMLHSSKPLTLGYLDEAFEDNQNVYCAPGLIASGDVGHLDGDGFLHLTGRKKEVLVTSSGHKVHPPSVERVFHELDFVKHAVVMGSNRPHLGLLLVLNDPPPDAHDRIQQQIKAANARVCDRVHIKKWHVAGTDFTPANGLLTRNLKLNRPRIHAAFEDAVFA